MFLLLSPKCSFLEAGNLKEDDQQLVLCDEIYVVGEGETLQTISEKCGDLFILVENTHINDDDDIYPGLSKYARDLLQKAGLEKCTSQPTPMAVSSSSNGPDTPFADITHFRSLIGALQYLAITRPDIHCIFGTLGRGLLIQLGDLELRGFSDSDWANDKNDRKSTSGFLVFLGPNLISWCTKKQPKDQQLPGTCQLLNFDRPYHRRGRKMFPRLVHGSSRFIKPLFDNKPNRQPLKRHGSDIITIDFNKLFFVIEITSKFSDIHADEGKGVNSGVWRLFSMVLGCRKRELGVDKEWGSRWWLGDGVEVVSLSEKKENIEGLFSLCSSNCGDGVLGFAEKCSDEGSDRKTKIIDANFICI
uniref:Reverse transcriptase Ty1/copia-type domain-containing protein n=1 Tax=Solanum lycopersicum TaxID=4081 RepID=A0A3Q7J825_SOLLC